MEHINSKAQTDCDLEKLARELAGEDVASTGSTDSTLETNAQSFTCFDLTQDSDGEGGSQEEDSQEGAEGCKHYEFGAGDLACAEGEACAQGNSVDVVDLLPVTAGSSRTAKRRFRRQRCRQRLRLLEQFPELKQREAEQEW